ncbi:MAG: hypothetical protein K6G50_09375, partial [bacterium]|nr:hypothetical protein [bacterium]
MRIFPNIAIALLSVAISTCACNKTGLDSAGDAASQATPAQTSASHDSAGDAASQTAPAQTSASHDSQAPASQASGSPAQAANIESPHSKGSNISDKDSTRPFSGPNAFAYVKAQTDIGTRVPGSEGSKAAQKLIT